MSDLNFELITLDHYGNWISVLNWVALFGLFFLFLPYHKKSNTRPERIYLAFIVASALEMYGVPLSLYIIAWIFGITTPVGIFWGHTLSSLLGFNAMYIGYALNILGGLLIILGWRKIFFLYWRKEEGDRKLVTNGIYSFSRHPQYLGFLLMTLGLLVHWATLPLLVMWPILLFRYYTLAKREEKEMEEEFGEAYIKYKTKTPMFLGRPFGFFGDLEKSESIERARFIFRSISSAIILLFLFIVVMITENSFEHTISELGNWWPWLLIQLSGFGLHVGMYQYIRDLSKNSQWGGSLTSIKIGSSAQVLPIIGFSAATLLLIQNQSIFLSLGVLSSLIGIVLMFENLQRYSNSTILSTGLMKSIFSYNLRKVRNITAISSVFIFLILLSSSIGILPFAQAQQEQIEISDTKNGVTFSFKKIDYEDAIAFSTGINTHPQSLAFDLIDIISIEIDGNNYKPLRWEESSSPEWHHRLGVLVFPNIEEIGEMKIIIRDFNEISVWVFDIKSSTSYILSLFAKIGIIGVISSSLFLVSKSKRTGN
jgi:protein-S-isoprenylcysteine O-methyltransferase Ste14